ncbi:hypothetical protein LV164_005346 [Aspergillus fumigatus]|nr:hypothetical protein KXX42_000501 [Aspergillus fumigatus]KAH1546590.1 hypothetical protein KXX57_003364 [Aspergillus fumigatus]KAH1982571.1 hypothetical protein KXW88_004191 [Aspergillus fumigatus]KAH2313634.1 hypothetical protein KXV47_003174 [Aspergillus fumigatus]KAH2656142.1 hypothetical protein KXV32_002443 [Aspergillus fumigatus]
MTRTIHIAVLDVDIPPRSLYETHGLCSAHFRHALQDAATRFNALTPGSDIRIAVTPYDIRGGHYPDFRHLRKTQTPLSEHSIDAILITGGAPGVYEIDKRPWMQTLAKFLQTVFREYPAVRIMGTCFGHQLIGHALVDSGAGDVYVEKCPLGREVGIHTVQLNRDFVDAFPLALGHLPNGQLKIQMFHGDRVMVKGGTEGVLPETAAVSLPAPWVNIGSTPLCPIQGMYYPGRVLSVQGHYELDACGMQSMCLELAPLLGWTDSKLGLFLEQVGDDYNGRQDDSEAFALAVVCFLAGE